MTSFDTLRVEYSDTGIVRLILNRPDKRNALSKEMIAELTDFATQFTPSLSARAVILSGAGDIFCAGGDLRWMQEQMQADRDTRMAEAKRLAYMLQALNRLPVPLIGQVQGGAFGGGVGMMSVCDIVIAQTGAKFGLTEARLGLIPATISPYVVGRVGPSSARELFTTAKIFDVDMARRVGLVQMVEDEADLGSRAEAEAQAVLGLSVHAVAQSKALIRALGHDVSDEIIEKTITILADTWEHPDASEGINAFFEKRPPAWTA